MIELNEKILTELTVNELKSIFQSIEPKGSKTEIIDAIIKGNRDEGEIKLFAEAMERRKEDSEQEKKEADAIANTEHLIRPEGFSIAETREILRSGKRLIVKTPIKEDGKFYNAGDEYKGKYAKRFLRDGQIRPAEDGR